MKYQIDQSGKVEDTNKLTIVAFANGKTKTLLITAVEKRKLLIAMRAISPPKKTFIYKIFAGLIFLLIKNEKIDALIIDREYPGHEALIRSILTVLFCKTHRDAPEIDFGEISRASKAHKIAIETFHNKRKPDMLIKARDVLYLFTIKKRKPRF